MINNLHISQITPKYSKWLSKMEHVSQVKAHMKFHLEIHEFPISPSIKKRFGPSGTLSNCWKYRLETAKKRELFANLIKEWDILVVKDIIAAYEECSLRANCQSK